MSATDIQKVPQAILNVLQGEWETSRIGLVDVQGDAVRLGQADPTQPSMRLTWCGNDRCVALEGWVTEVPQYISKTDVLLWKNVTGEDRIAWARRNSLVLEASSASLANELPVTDLSYSELRPIQGRWEATRYGTLHVDGSSVKWESTTAELRRSADGSFALDIWRAKVLEGPSTSPSCIQWTRADDPVGEDAIVWVRHTGASAEGNAGVAGRSDIVAVRAKPGRNSSALATKVAGPKVVAPGKSAAKSKQLEQSSSVGVLSKVVQKTQRPRARSPARLRPRRQKTEKSAALVPVKAEESRRQQAPRKRRDLDEAKAFDAQPVLAGTTPSQAEVGFADQTRVITIKKSGSSSNQELLRHIEEKRAELMKPAALLPVKVEENMDKAKVFEAQPVVTGTASSQAESGCADHPRVITIRRTGSSSNQELLRHSEEKRAELMKPAALLPVKLEENFDETNESQPLLSVTTPPQSEAGRLYKQELLRQTEEKRTELMKPAALLPVKAEGSRRQQAPRTRRKLDEAKAIEAQPVATGTIPSPSEAASSSNQELMRQIEEKRAELRRLESGDDRSRRPRKQARRTSQASAESHQDVGSDQSQRVQTGEQADVGRQTRRARQGRQAVQAPTSSRQTEARTPQEARATKQAQDLATGSASTKQTHKSSESTSNRENREPLRRAKNAQSPVEQLSKEAKKKLQAKLDLLDDEQLDRVLIFLRPELGRSDEDDIELDIDALSAERQHAFAKFVDAVLGPGSSNPPSSEQMQSVSDAPGTPNTAKATPQESPKVRSCTDQPSRQEQSFKKGPPANRIKQEPPTDNTNGSSSSSSGSSSSSSGSSGNSSSGSSNAKASPTKTIRRRSDVDIGSEATPKRTSDVEHAGKAPSRQMENSDMFRAQNRVSGEDGVGVSAQERSDTHNDADKQTIENSEPPRPPALINDEDGGRVGALEDDMQDEGAAAWYAAAAQGPDLTDDEDDAEDKDLSSERRTDVKLVKDGGEQSIEQGLLQDTKIEELHDRIRNMQLRMGIGLHTNIKVDFHTLPHATTAEPLAAVAAKLETADMKPELDEGEADALVAGTGEAKFEGFEGDAHWEKTIVVRQGQLHIELERRSPPMQDFELLRFCDWLNVQMPRAVANFPYIRKSGAYVDLSENAIGPEGLDKLFRVLRDHRVPCVVMKCYRNILDDKIVDTLTEYLHTQPESFPMHGIHISHNSVSDKGAMRLIRAAASCGHYPRYTSRLPLWLRLECNEIINPQKVVADCSEEGFNVCLMQDGFCSKPDCNHYSGVHVQLPFFLNNPGRKNSKLVKQQPTEPLGWYSDTSSNGGKSQDGKGACSKGKNSKNGGEHTPRQRIYLKDIGPGNKDGKGKAGKNSVGWPKGNWQGQALTAKKRTEVVLAEDEWQLGFTWTVVWGGLPPKVATIDANSKVSQVTSVGDNLLRMNGLDAAMFTDKQIIEVMRQRPLVLRFGDA